MKKLWKPGKDSIVRKMTVTNILIFSIFSLLILGVMMFFNIHYHIVRDTQMMKVYISNVANAVDTKLHDMGRVSMVCFTDDGIQDILKNFRNKSLISRMEDEQYLKKIYASMMQVRNDIDAIYLFDKDGMIYYDDVMGPSLKQGEEGERFFYQIRSIAEQYPDDNGCHMYVDVLSDSFRYVEVQDPLKYYNVYLVRPIRSFSPFEVIGYIAIRTKVEKLDKVCVEYLEDGVSYYLVDENNLIACSSSENVIGMNIQEKEQIIYDQLSGSAGSFLGKTADGWGLVCYEKSVYSNMTLLTTKPLRSILVEMGSLVIMCLIILFFGVIVIMLAVSRTTRKKLEGLTVFANDLRDFQTTDLLRDYDIDVMDEVGVLKDSFNKMTKRLNKAVTAELEAQRMIQKSELSEQRMAMLYLKQQINPHFLYNTLDIIRIKAAMNDDREVSEMLMKLVRFYRLSTRISSQYVEVQQEMEMLDAYMGLMQYRYPNLKYQSDIKESTLKKKIPNFTLQPLIENSLLHGLKDRNYEGNIWLNVWKTDNGDLHLLIMDDGIGMSEDTLQQLNGYGSKNSLNLEEHLDSREHIGIQNVGSRLTLLYPDRCWMKFYINQRGYTCVEIMIQGGHENEEA